MVISRNFARLQKKNQKPKPKKPRKPKAEKILRAEGHKIYDEYFEKARAVTQVWTEERLAAKKEALDTEGKAQRELALERERDREVLEEINRENEKIAAKRKLLLENKEKYLQLRLKRKEQMLEKKKLRLLERRTAIVREAIEASKNFVTLDNLEDKITECLESEVNYNFALTTHGEKIYSTTPPGNFGKEWQFPGPIAYEVTQTRPVGGEWDWVFDKRLQQPKREDTESLADLLDMDDFDASQISDKWKDQSLEESFLDMIREESEAVEGEGTDVLEELRDEVPEDDGIAQERDELFDILEGQEEDIGGKSGDELWDSLRAEEIKAARHKEKTGSEAESVDDELEELLDDDFLQMDEAEVGSLKDAKQAMGDRNEFLDMLQDEGEVADDVDRDMDFLKEPDDLKIAVGESDTQEKSEEKSSEGDSLLDFLKSDKKSDKDQ